MSQNGFRESYRTRTPSFSILLSPDMHRSGSRSSSRSVPGILSDKGGEDATRFGDTNGVLEHFFPRFEELEDDDGAADALKEEQTVPLRSSTGWSSPAPNGKSTSAARSPELPSRGSSSNSNSPSMHKAPAMHNHSVESTTDEENGKEEDLLDLFDSVIESTDTGSPPTSDYSPVEEKPITPRKQGISIKGSAKRSGSVSSSTSSQIRPSSGVQTPDLLSGRRALPHRPSQQNSHPSRPHSPTSSSLSVGASNLSNAFTQVSVGQAARSWNEGGLIPLNRDANVLTQKASRYDHDLTPSSKSRVSGTANGALRRGTGRPMPLGRQMPPRPMPGIGNDSLPPRPPHPSNLKNREIRISKVPQGSKRDELYSLLAENALHRYPFSTRDKKLNFWIHLPRARETPGSWGQTNEGYGFLTLPTLELTQKFLSMYGQNGNARIKASHAREPLVFELGQKIPPAGLVEWITRVPYPEKGDRSQRVLNDRKADNLSLLRVEFGVFCKDGVFSPEYIKIMKNATFSFDTKWKSFRISLRLEGDTTGSTPSTRLIVIKSSAIRLILSSVSEDEYSVTLIMHHPPSYEELAARRFDGNGTDEETETGPDGTPIKKIKPREYAGRQRRPAFDSGHQSTSAFTSRVIRLVFEKESIRNDFEDLLQVIGCPAAKYVDLEDDHRKLYSRKERQSVHSWLETLDSRSVAFQLARLYQNSLLVPSELLALKPIVDRLLAKKGPFVTADVLHQFVEELTKLEDRWYDRILKDKSYKKELAQKVNIGEVLQSFEQKGLHRIDWRENYQSAVMQCLHVILTPVSMILEGPYPDQSNRPLRKYGHHDHFVRVAFMDEDKQSYFWGPDIDWTAFLDERVGAILRNGIKLGGKPYDFLGYSMSSLRSRSTWFCTPFQWEGQEVNADYIRRHLGDFDKVKRQPARYGARMAQAFTATDPSIVLSHDQIVEIPDVEKMYKGEKVCFTDGVGKISLEMTKKVWSALHNGMEPVDILPSAFQFRLGGYKGVLTVDSELEGEKICVRPSQQKFDAPDSTGLEVAYTYCRHVYMFLNRPLIKVLEDLHVPHKVFLDLLKDAVQKAEELKQYIRETRRQLTLHGLGGSFSVTELVENIGILLQTNTIQPFKESGPLSSFIAESLEFAEVHILRLLKLKARIPIRNAHVGVAIADESGTLKEGEIYSLRHNPGEPVRVVQGDVLLVRAPTVDVGDVQIAKAVGTPPPGAERFKHIPNAVIFSIQGEKPLLNSLSRGDMDGDLVGVISDPRLFPARTEPAMVHKPKIPVELDRDCTINEVIDFVLHSFRNDVLGMVASRHLLIADQAPSGYHEGCGTRHPSCKKLAELQTIAVDAPKSGQSVNLTEMPRPLFPHRPDFMQQEQLLLKSEPDDEALIYHSQKILGKLYRSIRLTSREEDNQILKEAPSLDDRYIPAGEDDHILIKVIEELQACGLSADRQETDVKDRENAWYTMHTYASDLRHIAWSNTMNAGHPLSEHELFIGTILHGALATKAKQELISRINLQCKELNDGVYHALEGTDGRDRPQMWTNRVLAALRVAVSQSGNFGAQAFGCLAVKSALALLVLMRDVHRADMLTSAHDYDGEAPFIPTFTASAQIMPGIGEIGMEGGFMGVEAVGIDLWEMDGEPVDGDTGGDMAWGHEKIVDAEASCDNEVMES